MARLKQVQRKLAPKGNTIVNISKTFKALHKLQLQSKLTGGIKEPRNWMGTELKCSFGNQEVSANNKLADTKTFFSEDC